MAEMTLEQALQFALQLHQCGQLADAQSLYLQILSHDSRNATVLHMLGVLAGQSGDFDHAIHLIQQALELAPGEGLCHSNLGKIYFDQGRLHDSIASSRRALELDPTLAEAHFNLGNALYATHQLDPAIESFRQALHLRPDYVKAHLNLGNALKDRAEFDDAIASLRRAVSLAPHIPQLHSNLLFSLMYHPDTRPADLLAEARLFDRRHAVTLAPAGPPPLTPSSMIRIGYISPDFREHCQSLFTLPLFTHHDTSRFHITAYSGVPRPDAVTARLQAKVHQWRDISKLSDAAAAQLIRDDRIDILVDLTMHMANNRLLVLARKPAPIQLSYLAYPGTTGLSAIDYRLTDPHLDPPGSDAYYSETSLRLPHTFWCYDPLADLPPCDPPPVLSHGHITFGCLNNPCKIGPHMLALWCKLLMAVPHSRLVLLVSEGRHRARLLDTFAQHAIRDDRITFVPFRPRLDYLNTYREIDIALDTLPYNGHTTSLDALWMGVPLVTLAGQTPLARAGLSQLTNLQLPGLIAHTDSDYLAIATELAGDLPQLTRLHQTLRSTMQKSPLMNARQFTRGIELLYENIYKLKCGN